MGWINLIGGHHAFHSIANIYDNIVNDIANVFEPTPQTNIITNDTFVEPTSPTNIITNETFLTQYSIQQGLRVLV